jgi:hypothetical protein
MAMLLRRYQTRDRCSAAILRVSQNSNLSTRCARARDPKAGKARPSVYCTVNTMFLVVMFPSRSVTLKIQLSVPA